MVAICATITAPAVSALSSPGWERAIFWLTMLNMGALAKWNAA